MKIILRQAQDERGAWMLNTTVHPELVEGWIEGFSSEAAGSCNELNIPGIVS